MQNNSFKFKPLKRAFNNPNYPGFKTLKPNFYPHINKPNNETIHLTSLSQDNSQNNNSRSVFFQTFWKNYSKSYEYEYFLTSLADSNKINTYLTEEINKIVDENPIISKENVLFLFISLKQYIFFKRKLVIIKLKMTTL